MASCCPGVTECEHVITIGFLNTFIGSDIQDSNGNATSAAGDNTYCPTYSELTGGTLIQNWKKGATPNEDRDGIVIGGSYASNECVRREDLSMKYTRFKSLDVSASPLEIDACSGCSTLSFAHLYNRYEKKLNGSCEGSASPSVEEASDTVSGHVSYSSSNNVFSVNGNQVCVGKNNPNNNGRSNSRSTVITAKITFRGTNHTDTVTITQAGLTGTYKFWYSTYSTHDNGVTCTGGPNFGCAGGSYGATAYYYRDDWDVYRYQDKCGTNYDSDTEQRNRVNNQYRVYDTYSGSFPDNTGTGGPADTDSVSWPGYGSCSWSQSYCPPPDCPNCDCDDIVWGYGTASDTVDCTGGTVRFRNVTIPGTAITYTYDEETSACTVTTAATSETRSTSVSIGCNMTTSPKTYTGTKDNISYSISQPAGPCCTPSVTYQYETVSLTCEAHENESVRAKFTAVTVDECCSTTYPTAYTEYYTVNVGCNSGSTRYLTDSEKSNAPFLVRQAGNSTCCIPACNCDTANLNVAVTSAGASIPASGYTNSTTLGTYNNSTCLTGVTATSSENWITNISVSNGNVNATVQSNSSTENERTGIITVSGVDAYGTTCSDPFDVSQAKSAITCTCGDLTIAKTSESWDYDSTVSKDISISSASCISSITVNTLSHFNATLGTNKVTVSPKATNTGTTPYVETLTISYKASNTNCSSAVTLTQEGQVCSGVTYSFTGIPISCDAVIPVNNNRFYCDYERTEKYVDGGVCKTDYVHSTGKYIWNETSDGVSIPANTGNTTLYHTVPIYLRSDGTFFTSSSQAGGGPKIGEVSIPQVSCTTVTCIPGTDNAEDINTGNRHPFNLSCSDTAITSDHYLGAWDSQDQNVYGRNVSDSQKKNVSSEPVWGSVSNWSYYLNWLNADDMYEANGLTNSYGFKSKNANDTGSDIWVKVKHTLINQSTQPAKSDTCSEWYSWLKYSACESHTYVVYSNVEGATVDFYSNTSNHHYTTTTINNGVATAIIAYGDIKVVISKENCTFSPNVGYVTYTNDTVTLNGSCSAPVDTCKITNFGLVGDLSSVSSTSSYIGGFSTSGNCTSNWRLEHVSGDDFISNIEVRDNGGIYAAVAENTSSSPRTSIYRFTNGSVSSDSTITQLGRSVSCVGTLSLYANLNGNGASTTTGDVIGSYSTNGCTSTPTIEYISGDNFLINPYCDGNGNVLATYNYNGSGAVKNAVYGLYVNGIQLSTSSVSQATGSFTPCEADVTVSTTVNTTTHVPPTIYSVQIGKIIANCSNFDKNKVAIYFDGPTPSWVSIAINDRLEVNCNVTEPNLTGSDRTATFSIDYNDESIGGTYYIVQQH